MARLDPSRAALELDEVELTVANLVLTSPGDALLETPEAHEGFAQLASAGIVEDGLIQGYPAWLLEVILVPELRVMVERFAGGETQRDFGAATSEAGVWGEARGEGRTEFTPIEPELIPWAVARAVGLGPRKHAPVEEALELRASVLEATLSQLAAGNLDRARDELSANTSLDEAGRAALIELLIQRRLSWRVLSAWEDEAGEQHTASVAVIDGGDGGLWLSEHLNTDQSDPTIRLEATDPSIVWDKVVAMMSFPLPPEPNGVAP